MIERLAAGEPMPTRSDPAQVERVLHAIASADQLPPAVDPRYAVGDRVRVKRMRPDGHNRCPRYLRGAEGVVERIHCNDRRPGAGSEPVYAVAFTGAELWGADAERSSVVADLLGGVPGACLVVDGVHDVGGMQGFGAAYWPGSDEPTHAEWELRAFVLALVTGPGSSHAFRHTIERLDPVRYLQSTYYERWLYEAEQALVEAGAITHAEVVAWEARLAAGDEPPRRADPERAARLVRALRRRRPLEPADDSRFAIGDRVRVRRVRPAGHTRCPRYLRGGARNGRPRPGSRRRAGRRQRRDRAGLRRRIRQHGAVGRRCGAAPRPCRPVGTLPGARRCMSTATTTSTSTTTITTTVPPAAAGQRGGAADPRAGGAAGREGPRIDRRHRRRDRPVRERRRAAERRPGGGARVGRSGVPRAAARRRLRPPSTRWGTAARRATR